MPHPLESEKSQDNEPHFCYNDVALCQTSNSNKIKDENKRFDKLVELNVMEQAINVIKIDHVQRSWYKTGFPTIHGWVFDVRNGKLKDLELDMEKIFNDYRAIYDLKPLDKKDESH